MAKAKIPKMETLYLTKAEYKERFDIEFKHLSRSLKEMGCYKFIITYIFSHHNKTKNDLFESMCRDKTCDGNLMVSSLIHALAFKTTLGYRLDEFPLFDSAYWDNNISHIHYMLRIFYAEGFVNYDKRIFLTD
jgi:hypothetical protein